MHIVERPDRSRVAAKIAASPRVSALHQAARDQIV
ncbi:hypothetical protein F4561_006327 [Lipingzhangella halophila]|uniref:Uncharacterized protein n=1 Tax=Lipingzhangella halophila TaxID=1783352 RepID=A0A7W7RNT7_9ACTN|nr:hypothetical protein [Lipingzhangella halophila]